MISDDVVVLGGLSERGVGHVMLHEVFLKELMYYVLETFGLTYINYITRHKVWASSVVHKIVCPPLKKNKTAYCKKLYDSPGSNKVQMIRNFLGPLKLTNLDEYDCKAMAEPITENKIKEVIMNLKNNKSPGTDGYYGEFYKFLQAEITPLLQRVFSYVLNKNDLPKTWSEAIISGIYKERKDSTECASYRPISLLCYDMKILSTVMVRRIQLHINKIIKPDQTGFIPGRQVLNYIVP